MQFSLIEAAAATGGTIVGVDAPCTFDGASIDSRSIGSGQLFVPIVAERDGHDFIAAAFESGAAATLTTRADAVPVGRPAVLVDDTMRALTALGVSARGRLRGHVIGITGSVGKTSTKDLMASVLGVADRNVHASDKSFNNEMGVPLTLLNVPDDVAADPLGAVVVEMGARGVGHIDALCAVARPTVAVVTVVGAVHTSEFGDLETVAAAKAELVAAVPADGAVILNADDDRVRAMRTRTQAPVLFFGFGEGADVGASNVMLDGELHPSFTLVTPGGEADVTLSVRGQHNVLNALAAAAVGHLAGLTANEIASGLGAAGLSPWRMEVGRSPVGALVINDAYNANPMSMAAGLQALAAVDAGRRIAVLGVMAELGDLHDAEHASVAAIARHLGIEIIAFQEAAFGVEPVHSIAEALEALGELSSDVAVLVKGSRVAQLERLAEQLLG